MLRLSELSGFLVGGNRFEKICGKISAKNCKIKPLTIETMGRGDWGSGCVCTEYITPNLAVIGKMYAINSLEQIKFAD